VPKHVNTESFSRVESRAEKTASNGMKDDWSRPLAVANSGMPTLNSYALVAYLRGPLADFVDNLRRDITPGCTHRAHITVLPPRPLAGGVEEAIAHCEHILRKTKPFDVRAGAVSLFDTSEVIKLSVDAGAEQLRDLHDELNQGPLRHAEKFAYEPHITLAQDVATKQLQDCLCRAQDAWRKIGPAATFALSVCTFVQEVKCDCWSDLATVQLGVRNGSTPPVTNGASRVVAPRTATGHTPTARR